MLHDDLRRRELDQVPDLRRLLAVKRRSHLFYSTRDLVEAYGIAGSVVNPDPLLGIRELFTGTARYFSGTWFGRAFARYLRPNPSAALSWIERSRYYVADYGRWRLEMRTAEHAVLHMFDEYFWIEAAQVGGCEGLLMACGLQGQVSAELDDTFSGRLQIRWSRPA
jgi:Protein of unknown function (DUF2378)